MLKKSINLNAFNKYHRYFSSVTVKKREKNGDEPKIHKDLLKHFDNADRKVAFEYPENILKKFNKKKKLDGLYLADNIGVDKIFDVITKNLPDDKPIIEVNPGEELFSSSILLY